MKKYEIGQKVKIKKDLELGKYYGSIICISPHFDNKGKIVTITDVTDEGNYRVDRAYIYSQEMFEEGDNMKLIELLEKIEKGDNLPKKIKVDDIIYRLDEEYRDYKNEADSYLSEEIGSYAHIDLALKMEVKILNDISKLKLKEHIDLFELSKDSWCGCNQETMEFLKEHYDYDWYFTDIEERHNCYVIDGLHVNKKCFDVID